MLRTPKAAAPRMSPCSAMRLRSRQENCATGVSPFATRMAAAAALDMWQLAPAPSVMLMASARSRKRDARAISTPGSLESGGETSTVTTKRPDWQACSKPKVSRAGAAFGRMTVGFGMACRRSPAARTSGSKAGDRSVRERSCRAARRSASCRRSLRPRRSASSDRPRRCRRRARRRTARCASAWRNWSGRPCRSRTARTGRTSCNRTSNCLVARSSGRSSRSMRCAPSHCSGTAQVQRQSRAPAS